MVLICGGFDSHSRIRWIGSIPIRRQGCGAQLKSCDSNYGVAGLLLPEIRIMLCSSYRFNHHKRCVSPLVGHHPIGGLNQVSIEHSWHDHKMCNEGKGYSQTVSKVSNIPKKQSSSQDCIKNKGR